MARVHTPIRWTAATATVLLSVALGAERVSAGCATSIDARALQRTIRAAARCNDNTLKKGAGTMCQYYAPPSCAGTLATDAVALAYGANNPPAAGVDRTLLRSALNCQRAIGRAVTNYVGRKLRLLVKGVSSATADAQAGKVFDHLPDRCAVTVALDTSTVVVPAVGPQCGAAVPSPGGSVDGTALGDCVRTLLSVWVDRWGPNPQPLRPNILFILTDDQRWDTLDDTHGLSPGANVMPRTLAELADHGISFTSAFMATPLCAPSRASILSGQYAHRTGVYKNGGTNGGADDFADAQSIAVWLQDAGYRTSLMGKYLNGYSALWTTGNPPYVPPGWTEWRGMKSVAYYNYTIVEPNGMGGYVENSYGATAADYSTDVLREKAKTFITDSVALGEPFFLYLAFKTPHGPFTPAPRHDGMFLTVPPWRPPSYNEADVSDKPSWVQALPFQDSMDLDGIRQHQLEMVQAVDEAIGGSTTFAITGIMEHLRSLGIADDTMVVYFADNGWYWGEHRLRAKNNPYEEDIRDPMFVSYSKLTPLPRAESQLALNIDLASTFAELAGVPTPLPITQDGRSLLHVIDGTVTTQPWRTDFLTESWPASHPWATVNEAEMNGQQWKYTEIPVTPGDPNTTFETELYDIIADPYELTNVVTDPQNAARVTAMAARLRELRQNWPIDSDPNGVDPPESDDN